MDQSNGGLTVRSMKLKVLYTFDAEHRHNHLARWPETLDIKTIVHPENGPIGVIDLGTCLEAITSASPELVSNHDNDFNIYHYDYSEPEAPLAPKGLLSRAFDVGGTSEEELENLVAGRVTKNAMGLFASNAQETLEVKLRLTPVSTSAHSSRLGSGPRRYSITSNSGQEFASQQWQSNASLMSKTESATHSASPMDASGLEAMQKMVSGGVTPRERSGSQSGDPFFMRANSRPPSRVGTPTLNQPMNNNNNARQSTNPGSRPSSRAGMWQPTHARRDSSNSGYYSGEENLEEGPSRKRAKIASVDHRRANYNIHHQPDSLRVAASTASSVRIHRPVPINPALALQTGSSAEEPVRPPTPIPTKVAKPRGRPPKRYPSHLHPKRFQARPSSPSVEPTDRDVQVQDTAVSSPEDARAGSISSTPADIPSSPPVMRDIATYPTSPALPTLPTLSVDDDSGFMSGNFEDFFPDNDTIQFDEFIDMKLDEGRNNVENRSQQEERQESVSSSNTYPPVFEEGNEVDESKAVLHPPAQSYPILAPAPPGMMRSQTLIPSTQSGMSSPKIAPARAPRYWGVNLPPIPASDPAARPLHRANTWTGDMSDLPTSDAPIGGELPKKKTGSKKRAGKDQTRARLESAIASGEMPPFCDNCGAIETPAWRRAYSREFDCPYDQVETSLEDGACVYKEPTEHNPDGSVRRFKGYKVTMRPEDREDQWVAISLCNPCGLWFHKSKCMRPPAKWNKKDKDSNEKKKRKSRPKKAKSSKAATGKSDAPTPASDGSSPADTATEAADADDRDDVADSRGGQVDSNEPELPPMLFPNRASSAEPVVKGLTYQASRRQVQSSPLRVQGSDTEPIELDLTPQPLRRQLFPSPDKDGLLATFTTRGSVAIATALPAFVRRSPRLNKTKDALLSTGDVERPDKENMPMTNMDEDGLGDLFDGGDNVELPPPTTPTPKRRSERLVLKTPGRSPGAEMSPNIQRLSGRHPIAAALLGTTKKLTEMTPFTRSIHEALSDAPTHYARTSPTGPLVGHLVRTPKKTSPKKNDLPFDFPDLPSLNGDSPTSSDPMAQFNFSELTTDQMQTEFNMYTDMTMPSSPPTGFYNFANAHEDASNALWSEMEMGDFTYPDPTVASLVQPAIGGQTLRRSPRKKH